MEVVNEEKHVSCVKLSEFESTRGRVSWITYLKSSLEIGSEVIEIGLKTLKLSPFEGVERNIVPQQLQQIEGSSTYKLLLFDVCLTV